MKAIAIIATAFLLAACGNGPVGSSNIRDDSAGFQACQKFREVSFDASGEMLTAEQANAGLTEIGQIAQDSMDPEIRDWAATIAEEQHGTSLVNGDPDKALDRFADVCNNSYPLSRRNLAPGL